MRRVRSTVCALSAQPPTRSRTRVVLPAHRPLLPLEHAQTQAQQHPHLQHLQQRNWRSEG